MDQDSTKSKNSFLKLINEFEENKFQILVSTTIIEVGIDFPNANLIIIENANKFGLSQLHQLRGRVGRKADSDSHCLLLYKEPLSSLAEERIKTMQETNDGFEIAERDMALRGSGDLLGTMQSGHKIFKLSEVVEEPELFLEANKLVQDTETITSKPI